MVGQRALCERFLKHASYFERQVELNWGIKLLGKVMRLGKTKTP